MKKYIYSWCLLGAIVYSCKTQHSTSASASASSTDLTKSEMLKKGEGLFNLRCGRCHDLPAPSQFTAADWEPIMARMAPKAKLSADETKWVSAYVNANAKK